MLGPVATRDLIESIWPRRPWVDRWIDQNVNRPVIKARQIPEDDEVACVGTWQTIRGIRRLVRR